ncbi:MAG TPA: SWIM zinc finger family protein [Anaerolineae bacterium]|nr:SWIM zinc finger family protein [Anaerolineae bacterium]
MGLPKLTESIIRAGADAQSFQRGQAYHRQGAISNAAIQGNILTADCEGTSEPYYKVRVELDEAGIRSAECTCPYDYGGYCKHVVALLLTYLHHPEQFAVRKDAADLLADLSREDLIALLTKLLREQPELYDRVEAAISVPSVSGKAKKSKRKKVDPNVYRRQVSNILHSLDRMRPSEAYWHVGGLVEELRGVQASAMKFLDAGDADTALAILLALVEEAGDGITYIDDSNGELGGFLGELGQPLAEVILSLEMSAVEREQIANELKEHAKHLDDYGIDGALDVALEALEYGWEETPAKTASRRAPRHDEEFEEAPGDEDEWEVYEAEDEYDDEVYVVEQGWPERRIGDLTEARLNVLERQGRIDEYLELCQRTRRHLRYALKLCDLGRASEAVEFAMKHLTTAQEALDMAERLRALGHIAEAIAIGERGLKLAGPKVHLGEWLGPIEDAQGRTEQALQAWLAAFPEHPTLDSYKTLKRLAGSKWSKLQSDVMAALKKSHDTMALAEVLLFEEQWDEATKVADGRDVWYGVAETVADAVLAHRPEWVLRVSLQHADRLMVEPKSKNYPIAAEWLKRAKKAYIRLGKTDQWQKYLAELKEQYKRRPALQAQLQRL